MVGPHPCTELPPGDTTPCVPIRAATGKNAWGPQTSATSLGLNHHPPHCKPGPTPPLYVGLMKSPFLVNSRGGGRPQESLRPRAGSRWPGSHALGSSGPTRSSEPGGTGASAPPPDKVHPAHGAASASRAPRPRPPAKGCCLLLPGAGVWVRRVPEVQTRGAGARLHQQQPLLSERRAAEHKGSVGARTRPPCPPLSGQDPLAPGQLTRRWGPWPRCARPR